MTGNTAIQRHAAADLCKAVFLKFWHWPMTLMKFATILATTAALDIAVMVVFTREDGARRVLHEQLVQRSFPAMLTYLESAQKNDPCPDAPTFTRGCLTFGRYIVEKPDVGPVEVAYRWSRKGGPVEITKVMKIDDGIAIFYPGIDEARFKPELFEEMSNTGLLPKTQKP